MLECELHPSVVIAFRRLNDGSENDELLRIQIRGCLQNMQVQNGSLYIRGVAPSFEARDKFWNKVKDTDPLHEDLEGDIKVYLTRYSPVPVSRLHRLSCRLSAAA